MSGRVLVTGANGFVGRTVVPALAAAGWTPVPAGRNEVGAIGRDTDWRPVMQDISAIVHLAAAGAHGRVSTDDEIARLRETNVHGSERLAAAARDAGVDRFVLVSSARAMAESAERPLTAADPPCPTDPYGQSKRDGEVAVQNAAGEAMQIVVLRPPLVYGPGAGGAFGTLAWAVRRGVPLPFGSIRARRSMIFVENMADAIVHALGCPPGTYLPSDRHDVRLAELVGAMARALGRRPRLVPCPAWLLKLAAAATGRGPLVARLLAPYRVDGAFAGWSPPVPFEDAIARSMRGPDA